MGLGVAAAFILLVCLIAIFAKSPLTIPIKSQLAALRAGNVEKAYSYTSKEFRTATSLDDFETFVGHYATLRDNKSSSFPDREVKGDNAIIRGVLYGKDRSTNKVEYLLTKEDGEWRILGIQVEPTSVLSHENDEASNGPSTLMTYDNQDSRYTIKYPSTWEYEKSGDGTIIFSGKQGTAAYFSTVNIQTVLTKKTGGDFSTVKQFMADIKNQAVTQSPGVKFLESGPITVTEKNGAKDQGQFVVFVYTYKGKEFKQWQVVLLRNDGQVFYAWAYTAPLSQYPNDVGVAKAMLESWVIY
jgi:hypothetical protein